jgi:hypothetical protein
MMTSIPRRFLTRFSQAELAKFVVVRTPKAKHVELSQRDRSDRLGLLRELYSYAMEAWKIRPPGLLLSVTGNAIDTKMKPEFHELLTTAVVDAIQQTDGWIVTGGMDGGIMKMIGEMAAHQHLSNPVIGICSMLGTHGGEVLQKKHDHVHDEHGELKQEELDALHADQYNYDNTLPKPKDENGANKEGAFLNANHSHYILVSNPGETYDPYDKFAVWDREVAFRTEFEDFVCRGASRASIRCTSSTIRLTPAAVCAQAAAVLSTTLPNGLNVQPYSHTHSRTSASTIFRKGS